MVDEVAQERGHDFCHEPLLAACIDRELATALDHFKREDAALQLAQLAVVSSVKTASKEEHRALFAKELHHVADRVLRVAMRRVACLSTEYPALIALIPARIERHFSFTACSSSKERTRSKAMQELAVRCTSCALHAHSGGGAVHARHATEAVADAQSNCSLQHSKAQQFRHDS